MTAVTVVIGPGSIGQAIARRTGAGRHVVLADLRPDNAEAAAEVMRDAGFDVTTTTVDISSRSSIHALVETATALGGIVGLIHAAGVSPSQATPEAILRVDLYGTAVILEEFGNVIAPGGAGVVIASQSGHALAPSLPIRTPPWPPPPPTISSRCPCSKPTRSPTPCTPTSWPNEPTPCASWPKPITGPSAAPESTPSAPASS